ncbi:hypothetical protein B5E48_11500 [Massilimicrobiota sp. An105]|nr:hypothetical protein B5E48_11500 [Massilimicrobiota sp. An105]
MMGFYDNCFHINPSSFYYPYFSCLFINIFLIFYVIMLIYQIKGNQFMAIKMIAVDMDGTFLDENSSYNQKRFDHIYQILKDRGIRFVVASGNPYKKLQNCFPHIQNELTYIAENGGYIISEGKELYFAHISSQDSQLIIDTLQTMPDVLCWVCTKNQSYTLESLPEHYYQMFLPYFPHVKKVQNFSLIKEPIVKFALYLPQQNTTQRIHDLTQIASQDIRIVDSGHACIDIIPRFVSKGMAIQLLMKEFHISPDEVMAFGDADNDREMLSTVKYGYVMANAKEEMKKDFQWVAPGFNDEGVLEVIDYYLQNNSFFNL